MDIDNDTIQLFESLTNVSDLVDSMTKFTESYIANILPIELSIVTKNLLFENYIEKLDDINTKRIIQAKRSIFKDWLQFLECAQNYKKKSNNNTHESTDINTKNAIQLFESLPNISHLVVRFSEILVTDKDYRKFVIDRYIERLRDMTTKNIIQTNKSIFESWLHDKIALYRLNKDKNKVSNTHDDITIDRQQTANSFTTATSKATRTETAPAVINQPTVVPDYYETTQQDLMPTTTTTTTATATATTTALSPATRIVTNHSTVMQQKQKRKSPSCSTQIIGFSNSNNNNVDTSTRDCKIKRQTTTTTTRTVINQQEKITGAPINNDSPPQHDLMIPAATTRTSTTTTAATALTPATSTTTKRSSAIKRKQKSTTSTSSFYYSKQIGTVSLVGSTLEFSEAATVFNQKYICSVSDECKVIPIDRYRETRDCSTQLYKCNCCTTDVVLKFKSEIVDIQEFNFSATNNKRYAIKIYIKPSMVSKFNCHFITNKNNLNNNL